MLVADPLSLLLQGETYYERWTDILHKIHKSWSDRNVVVRVCGGVARESCVLIETSSTRPGAMTF